MSVTEVTVIYPFRDREVTRLEQSVESLRRQGRTDCEVLVVDFGSTDEYRETLNRLCDRMGLVVARTETEGWPWSRSQALNVGAVRARGEFILTTDIDVQFRTDPIGPCLDVIAPQTKIHCAGWFLPPNGSRKAAWSTGHGSPGMFQFISRAELLSYSGFNERIIYWGSEDTELHLRLTRLGFRTLWVEDRVTIVHTWHPVSYGMWDHRPAYAVELAGGMVVQAGVSPKLYAPKSVGQTVGEDQRPILSYVKRMAGSAYAVETSPGTLARDFEGILTAAADHKFIKVNIGPVYLKKWTSRGNSRRFWNLVGRINSLEKRTGITFRASTNPNLNIFMHALPALQVEGMRDYYISSDENTIYMLFD